MNVPRRIALLPTTRTGLPVPYVARWSSEQEETLAPEPRAEGLLALFSKGGIGQGEPVLGEMDTARQRECMYDLRCQVCHRQLSMQHAYLASWRSQEVRIGIGGPRLPLIMEPWACFPCLSFALRACPGIAGIRRTDPDFQVIRPRRMQMLVAKVDPIALDFQERSAVIHLQGGAVSYIKAAPESSWQWTADEFLRLDRRPA